MSRTEEDAKKAFESRSITLPGKGLNFIPTPTENISEKQLDMWLNTNRILRTENTQKTETENHTDIIKSTVPSRLSGKVYAAAAPAEQNGVNNIINNITEEHNRKFLLEKRTP